jgi:aryl-alcohol dehydrogenase-like predicted oxidoreductase
MKTRQLGRSDLEITPIGLGAWAIGGEWLFGWGPQDDADSIQVIEHAIASGVNWIDTAPAYGLGHSEEMVGRALRAISATDRPLVFTKCSLVWDEHGTIVHNLRPDSLRRECDASLRRLGVDRIDLYQIHWPKWPSSPPGWDSGSLEEAWHTLVQLQQEGKLRHLGVSNCDVDQLERISAIAAPVSLQPPYSLLRRDVEARILPWCRAHDVGVIVYSPMQSGLLTGRMTRDRIQALPSGDWRRKATWFNEPQLSIALRVVDRVTEIARRHGCSAAEVAIAWTLRHPAVTGAIVGARRPDQVDGFIGAADVQLTTDDLEEIDVALNTATATR